ncbi:PREDICTED: uncharacterized protein LOC107190840 [Dufourea novaeangliae]|uniref:uncharacterized protein LOC107190840 n=1 Tax=Dufourea novaeangliae TaxID=178035 RepID=UPI000767DEDD|nr:PREDICTED: uncharacterized protein LOC107190840 [Dufourea novaeangliae]
MAAKKMVPLPYSFSLEDELKKNPEIKMSDIEMLREWCEKQQHLPKISDMLLILFLHSNYYSIEAAKNTAENFFTIRSHVPEFFSNRDPLGSKDLRQAFNVVAATKLPHLSKQGYKILFGKLVDPDPSHYSFEDVTKYFFMMSDLVGLESGTCDGYIFIGDSSNVSLGHVGRISPMGMKKLVMYVQEAIPVRLKEIHFINTPAVMDVIMNMAKPFMKKELWSMVRDNLILYLYSSECSELLFLKIHLHSSLKSLKEFISPDLLPNEVGGKGESLSKIHKEQIQQLDDKREWFIEEEKLGRVDESQQIVFQYSGTPTLPFTYRSYFSRKFERSFKEIRMASTKPVTYEEELKRNSDLKEEDIQMLRDWSKKQPHLPKLTDTELVLFLHSNYHRIEPTKATIDTYYTVRTHVPEFFSHRDPLGSKELRKAFQTVTVQVLDKPTSDGYAILYGRLLDYEPSHYIYNDGMKFLSMIVDLWLYIGGTTPGHVILFDMKNVVFGHAARLSPMGLKKYLYYLQEALPVRLKGFHFMNITPVMDVILNMMKPFMKKELLDMLHTHTTLDTVGKFLPVDALPNEAGGKAGPLQELHEKSVRALEANREYFLEEERTKRVNETLRPGKGKSATDLFGVEGSFKKLDID